MRSRRAADPRKRREAGLTLIEMLLALALLAFVLLGITPLFMASVKSNYSGNEYTSINVLARDRLEQLMNLPFDDAQLTPGVHVNDLPATLPDPNTGVPPASGGIRNPFTVCYQVLQFRTPTGVPAGTSFHAVTGNDREQPLFVQADRRDGESLGGTARARNRHSPVPRQRHSFQSLPRKPHFPRR
jgi:hypothetical protein